MEWMLPNTADADPRWFAGDPADLVEAMATLLQSSIRPEWHARAACRGGGPAIWYPERGTSAEMALARCKACTVRAECLEAGQSELHGVWGGMSPRERRRAARLAKRQADAEAQGRLAPDPQAPIYELMARRKRSEVHASGS